MIFKKQTLPFRQAASAFTLIELLVVIAQVQQLAGRHTEEGDLIVQLEVHF